MPVVHYSSWTSPKGWHATSQAEHAAPGRLPLRFPASLLPLAAVVAERQIAKQVAGPVFWLL